MNMQKMLITAVLGWAGYACAAEQPLRFEAELYTTPASAWQEDRSAPGLWNLWSTDKEAQGKWSGGRVLQSPVIPADRQSPEEGAPVLHTVITGLPVGNYDVFMNDSGRTIGLSTDGQTWQPSQGGCVATNVKITGGQFELWIDDRYVNRKGNPGPVYYDYLEFRTHVPPVVQREPEKNLPLVQGWAKQRLEEKLDRGTVALHTARGTYVSWRLLAEDGANAAFDVYRAQPGGVREKVNQSPIVATADFLDATPGAATAEGYCVVRSGADAATQAIVAVARNSNGEDAPAYRTIALPDKSMVFQKVAVADLDGDGTLDYVLKSPNVNVDPWYFYWKPSRETYKLTAITSGGKHLWTRDLGWAIESGIWYSPYVVADLDGDGKAEVIVKTGPAADPRDKEGKVQTGEEWVSVWNGQTGEEIAKTPWPSREGFTGEYGYNFFSRNQLAIAYLDGKTPCVIALRGTYSLMKAEACQLSGGALQPLWKYSSLGLPRDYQGQGEHFTHAIDFDGDGRDEVMLGSIVLDDNGCPLWTTGLGHNDAAYISNIIPDRPGLQIAYFIESRASKNGVCVVDGKTGSVIWGINFPTYHIHGAGMCADIDPLHPGMELFGAECAPKGDHQMAGGPWLWSATGELLAEKSPDLPSGYDVDTVYWDGDLQRECLISKQPIDYQGLPVGGKFSGSVALIADLCGDWREEIVTSRPGEIRIYSTTIPAMDRRVCLLQDRVYRADVRMDSMGYMKIPSLSYCPSTEAANLNLTSCAGADGKRYCRIVVSAPRSGAVNATLKIEGGVIEGGAAEFPVSLKPGAFVTLRAEYATPVPGGRTEYLTATLNGEGISLRNVTRILAAIPVAVHKPKLPHVEAEGFRAQGGGEVKVRTDKSGVSDKCLSHWDQKGHWLEWALDIPAEGDYELTLRYSATEPGERSYSLDGQAAQTFAMTSTGGRGDTADEWQSLALPAAAGIRLSAGKHVLRMENISGTPVNLDYIAWRQLK